MITELTPEQEARLAVKRDEWIAIGLSTEPTDREAAEEGMRMAYRAAGLEPPTTIYWEPSPLAGARKAAALLNETDKPTSEQVRNSLSAACYGQHDAGWLAFYDVWTEFLEMKDDPLAGLKQVAKSASWWWPMDEAVVMTDRPVRLSLDRNGRLHNETGPAFEYADGFCGYYWGGTPVPEDLITEGWGFDRIMAESNAEIRRCAIEKFGWPEFVRSAGIDPIETGVPDPGNPGQVLDLYTLPEDVYAEPVNLLVCTNGTQERDGTRRTFGLTVPARIKTALGAAAWGYDIPVEEDATIQVRR